MKTLDATAPANDCALVSADCTDGFWSVVVAVSSNLFGSFGIVVLGSPPRRRAATSVFAKVANCPIAIEKKTPKKSTTGTTMSSNDNAAEGSRL